MTSLHYALSSLWNTTVSGFPATARYCEDNNINWTSTGNLARELGSIAVKGSEAIVGTATSLVAAGAGAAPGIAGAAKDLAAQGAQALGHGYGAFKDGCTTLSGKAADIGSVAWSGLKVQAPALGMALLDDMQNLVGTAAAMAHQRFTGLSATVSGVAPDGASVQEAPPQPAPEAAGNRLLATVLLAEQEFGSISDLDADIAEAPAIADDGYATAVRAMDGAPEVQLSMPSATMPVDI